MLISPRSDFRLWPMDDSRTNRTAVYGPVRTVVWEGRRSDLPPYPDPEAHSTGPQDVRGWTDKACYRSRGTLALRPSEGVPYVSNRSITVAARIRAATVMERLPNRTEICGHCTSARQIAPERRAVTTSS